jgi:DNA modification methylase
MQDYKSFIAGKHLRTESFGFDVDDDRLNKKAFAWQRLAVRYWLKLGRAGGFEDCGLGKTLQELIYAEQIILNGHGKRVLTLAPPAVAPQTRREAEKFGINVAVKVCRNQAEVESGITITNYERLHLFDPAAFDGVILDESSILKNFMGKTKQRLISAFRHTRFRLAATATPAPNDHLELGNHADFLGVMRANEMLARWFVNDSMHAGNYRLKGHAEANFWQWMASWAVSVGKPSDLGPFSDEGFELPPLNVVETRVGAERVLDGQEALSATAIHAAKRKTAGERADAMSEIVSRSPAEPWVLWCETDYEADELRRAVPGSVEVRGSQKLELKEELLQAFTEGQISKLITKPSIAGFGLNWQHCCNTATTATWSYERFYQLIGRFRRFGQTRQVNCHIVFAPEEESMMDTIREKSQKHEIMKTKMAENMRDWQQQNLSGSIPLAKPQPPRLESGDGWDLWLGDCVDVARSFEDDSIDYCISSPPFSNLYIYSDALADMGNSKSHEEFFQHYEFLIAELYRVTVPGRLCSVHCKDLPLYKGRDGAAGLYPFPEDIIRAFLKHGWILHSRCTIWKDPVTEMQRTKNHGLLHRQLCKDSSASRQGMADFLLTFRKWPDDVDEFPKPVTRGSDFVRFNDYVGEESPEVTPGPWVTKLRFDDLPPLEKADAYSIQVWQRYASPVWFDINQMRVLNYRSAREDKDEKHICPLQLDVIERAIDLWTNPGDLVYDPFNGIGSTGYCSLKMSRRYVGSELKDSYFRQSIANFATALKEREKQAEEEHPMLAMLEKREADCTDESLAVAV